MLRFILFILLLKCHFFGIGQSVITSTGSYMSGAQGSLSWTIGETISETISSGNGILTQGFQQFYDNFLATSELVMDGMLAVYPNPFMDEIVIQSNAFGNSYRLTLFDAQLKEIKSIQVTSTNGTQKFVIDLSDLSAGAYFLTIENTALDRRATRQIIKLTEKN